MPAGEPMVIEVHFISPDKVVTSSMIVKIPPQPLAISSRPTCRSFRR